MIKGTPNPVVGKDEYYTLVDYSLGLSYLDTSAKYKWRIRKQVRGTWKDITKEPQKIGLSVSFKFGEAVIGEQFSIEVYKETKNIFTQKNETHKMGDILVVPKSSQEPKITKVVLFNRGARDINKASYMDTLIAQAHCVGLFNQEIEFHLWEDDARGGGHHAEINKHNKSPKTYKARVNAKGIAEVKISLAAEEKVLRQIADRYMMTGDKNEGSHHEYYVTASYSGKVRGASQVNVSVKNPDDKTSSSSTSKPKPESYTPKFPATSASRTPTQQDKEDKIKAAYFVNGKNQRLVKTAVGEHIKVQIITQGMVGKHLQYRVWEHDRGKHDLIYTSERIKVKGDIITTGGFTILKGHFEKGIDFGSLDPDATSQNYYLEVIPLDISASSKKFGVDSTKGLMKVEKTKTATKVGKGDAKPTSANCGGKFCIKKGDKNELIREVNIRLAGFGGNVPTDEFTEKTERMIKQFQRDYMKVPETGKICGNVLRAIDEFGSKYIIDFESTKCPCGKCKGFGNGRFIEHKQNSKIAELKRNYEYPGIHRSLIWALRAAMFYLTVIEKDLKYSVKCIYSGYRCWENNKQNKRNSTNHMGKALDIHFNKNGKRTQVVKEVEEIRQKIFVKYLGNQVRWLGGNKFSLEPGIPAYKGEFIASTWIHYDVRQFELKYLEDNFFSKTIQEVDGESLVSLASKTNKQTCNCMGEGISNKINTPAAITKKMDNNFTIDDGKEALKIIYDKYGKDMAIIIERMYRDETAHFKSKQFKICGTGGMEVFGEAPYYGWDESFFESNPEFKPIGVWSAFENKGMSGQGGNEQVTDRKKEFVILPSVLAGMEYKVFYIKKHNGNWARWHSTKPEPQKHYREYLNKITPKFVYEFENKK